MKSTAVLMLLGQISAHRYHDSDMVQLDIEQGLGSLEGAYQVQKQLMKERASKWDESILGVTDSTAYAASQMSSLEEQ
jgi:osmotically-inducible protein OsmY